METSRSTSGGEFRYSSLVKLPSFESDPADYEPAWGGFYPGALSNTELKEIMKL